MRLEGTSVKYTEEDLKNLSVYDYTQEELDNQIEDVKNKLRIQGTMSYPVFLVSVGLFMVAFFSKTNGVEPLFLACICTAPCTLILALVFLSGAGKENGVYYTQYIKVEVAEKRGIIRKSWHEPGKKKGKYNMAFYPIMVKDPETGYRTRIYCFEDEYSDAREGKKIKLKYRKSLKRLA